MSHPNPKYETPIGAANDNSCNIRTVAERTLWLRCDIAMAIVCVLMFVWICIFSQFDVLRGGDSWSDVNTFIAGENYATEGLFRLHFLPVHYPGPLSDSPKYYMHYPPLAEIFNGLLQAIGITDFGFMRIIFGLFFIAGTVFMYRGLGYITGPVGAVCGIIFLASTSYFILYSTSLHSHALNIFFLGIFFFVFIRGIHNETGGKWRWMACWITLFTSSMVSFEFIIFFQIFAWLYVLATGNFGRKWRLLLLLATAPVAGVGLHFGQNIWAVGWSAAMADGMGFHSRDGGLCLARIAATFKVPNAVMQNSFRYLHVGWPCFAIMAALTYAIRDKLSSRMNKFGGALLLASLSAPIGWYMFMPAHTIAHHHIINQLLPLAIIVMGCGFAIVLKILQDKSTDIWVRILLISIVTALFLNNAYCIKPLITKPRQNLQRLGRVIGPEGLTSDSAYLCSTSFRGAYLRYFTKRATWVCDAKTFGDAEFLKKIQNLTDLPVEQFLYYSGGDYLNDELFILLASQFPGKQKRFQIPGQNEPSVLMLFDIRQLHIREDQREALNREEQEKQQQGIFPQWEIRGFDERLTAEFTTK